MRMNLKVFNVTFCLARACNGYMETADIALNLDIADIVKQKPSKYTSQ